MSPEGEDAAGPTHEGTEPVEPAAEGLELARLISRSLQGAARSAGQQGRSGAKAGSGGGSGGAGRTRRTPGRVRPTVSGAHPDERDPQSLASTVGRLVSDRGWQTELTVGGLFARWAELVGPEIADHATPEAFAEGRLTVRTDSTAWATQLTLLAPAVVRRLDTELGHGTVTFLDVQGPLRPSWRKGRLRVQGRGPRDTYG